MIIKPVVLKNISFNCHPLGMKENIKRQINYVKSNSKFKAPKNVLVLGGSSGYGLASVISLIYGGNSKILNVFLERPPENEKKIGSFGFWNNFWLSKMLSNLQYQSLNLDVFTEETKKIVQKKIEMFFGGSIDLLIYSIASPKRVDPGTNIAYTSTLKTLGEPFTSLTIDIAKKTLKEIQIVKAEKEDIKSTVKVMGGEDWKLWIEKLNSKNQISQDFQTMAFTYIGGKITEKIYRKGTIGEAKKHLETTAAQMQNLGIKAYVVSGKAIVSRASIFIPTFPVYAAALIKVMKKHSCDEKPIEHIYRFLSTMFLNKNYHTPNDYIYRPDSWELADNIQNEVIELLSKINEENFLNILDVDTLIERFYQLNGFNFDNINYTKDFMLNEVL